MNAVRFTYTVWLPEDDDNMFATDADAIEWAKQNLGELISRENLDAQVVDLTPPSLFNARRLVPLRTNPDALDLMTPEQRNAIERLIKPSHVNSMSVTRQFDLPDGCLYFTRYYDGQFKNVELTGGISPEGDVST